MEIKIRKFNKKYIDQFITQFLVSCLYIMLSYNLFRRVLGLNEFQKYIFLAMLIACFVAINLETVINVLWMRKEQFLILEISILILYVISYLMGNASVKTISGYVMTTCGMCVPMFVMASVIENIEVLYQGILKASYGMIVMSSLYIFAIDESEYSMGFSYIMLMPMLVLANDIFRKMTIKKIAFFLFIFFVVLLFGSRGAVLCVLVFVILRVLFVPGKKILKALVIISASLFLVLYQQIGALILNMLSKFNIESRSITLFFTDLGYVSGRDVLQSEAIDLLKKQPWTGYGVSSSMDLIGIYPHNVFVEILFDYGVVLGSIVFITLLGILMLFLMKVRKDTTAIFLCWGFVPLFLSGTYMREWKLFFLLGLVYGQLIRKRKRKKYRNDKNFCFINEKQI